VQVSNTSVFTQRTIPAGKRCKTAENQLKIKETNWFFHPKRPFCLQKEDKKNRFSQSKDKLSRQT